MDIKDKLAKLEILSRKLEPTADDRMSLREAVVSYTEKFIEEIEDYDKSPTFFLTKEKGAAIQEVPLGDPHTIEELINLVKGTVDKEGLNPASGGHLGYVPGGGVFTSALADYWADITNRYAGVFFANPGAVRMENHIINWIKELVGYPKEALGNLASGGSISNLIAIVTAREAKKLVPAEYHKAVVYLSSATHHCVHKALNIAGLKEAVWRKVPIEDNCRMSAEMLEKYIKEDREKGLYPWLLIASAGTTDTGALDPLDELQKIAEKEDLWFHIDGAYGGFFKLLDEYKEELAPLAKADSIVLDPHKGLFIPYGSGVVVIRDGEKLRETFQYTASYLQDTTLHMDEISPADVSPELTKHFRGLRIWLPLMYHGVEPFRAALQEKIYLARYFYHEVQKIEGIQIGPYPDMSIVTFRYVPEYGDVNEFNQELVRAIQTDGRLFLSSTNINNKFVIRLAVLSFRTHLDTIDLILQIIREKIEVIKDAPHFSRASNKQTI